MSQLVFQITDYLREHSQEHGKTPTVKGGGLSCLNLAEREGFEPSIPLQACWFSSRQVLISVNILTGRPGLFYSGN